MTQKSLVDEIITIIKSEANNNPAPERCRIRKVYPDKVHADIETRHGLLKYVDVVGYNPKLGDNAIIIYLDEDYKDYVVVADTVDEVVDIVTSWEATLSDEKVPSEKLTKTELDKKIAKSNTTGLVKNDGSIDTTSYSTFSGSYGDLSNKPSYTATVTSSTTGAYEIGTINVSGSSQTIYGKDTGGTSVDIVTSWESTPSDSKVASEKLVKDSLDAKQATLTSGTNIKTVNSTSLLGSGDISIPKGDDGSLFWTTTTAPTTPNYTFTIANLTGETGKTPKKGDIIFYSYYRYTVDTVGTTTLKATPRQSIRGSTGAAGAEGATGNGISSITKTGTSGLVDTYTITYTNTDTDTFTVTNGSDATVTIVDDLTSDSSTSVLSAKQGKVLNTNKIETSAIATSFGSTPSDSKVPSEKLVKTELDKKIATSNTSGLVKNDGTIDTNTYLTSASLSGYQTTSNLVTSFSSTTSDSKYPSEKLTKTELDKKIEKSSTTGLVKNDGTIDTNSYITSSSLPTKTSDLTNDGSSSSDSLVYVETSATSGLLKNDGTIDTNSYSTTSHSHNQITSDGKITSTAVTVASGDNIVITDASDSSKIKRVANLLADHIKDGTAHTNIGSSASATQATINSSIDTALSNKVGKSQTAGLLKNDGSVETTSYSTFSGSYTDLSNKPSIPSSSSDLSDGSSLVKTSNTTGLLKNDGSVMSSGTGSSNWAVGNHTHSAYVNPTKVTSWSSTPSDDNVASEKLIKDSLDAKQATLVSGTSIKTINNESLLGSGNISVGGGSSVDIVTSWESTLSDSKVASEKLTKDTIDLKSDTTHTHGRLNNDGTISTTSSATMTYFCGIGASANTLYKSDKLSSAVIVDTTAHSNLGTSANATQATINAAIDTLIGAAITYIVGSGN